MGGRAARTKGHGFERKVASLFRWIYDRRVHEDEESTVKRGFQTRGGTAEAPDIEGLPFYPELKKQKSWPSIPGALKQAADGTDGRIPISITAKDREEPIVGMYLKHFLWLCEHFFTWEIIEKFKEHRDE